uniref:Potassium channel domain-containing protein n=1 Tax=Ditylum brightwellii TaxID=49249 RepID=A0A7S2A627_9STRA|mmetsp:Transcript_9230/g.13708  ORF Transcript_9230/g.13708 Transcript_9230/m.13708 type:complete len:480 (+) Transcript_9230:28-1467(+)
MVQQRSGMEDDVLAEPLISNSASSTPSRRNLSNTSEKNDNKNEQCNQSSSSLYRDQEDLESSVSPQSIRIDYRDDAHMRPLPENGRDPLPSKDVELLIDDLQDQVERAKRMYKLERIITRAIAGLFLAFWLVFCPVLFTYSENWTYQVSWYYSIQAGFGVGFGAITPKTQGIEVLLTLHIIFGALFVAFILSALVTRGIERMNSNRYSTNNITNKLLGQRDLGLTHLFVGFALLFLVIIGGVVYGMKQEKWSFCKSLLFILSTCQTSGLEAPTIKARADDFFNPLCVMCLVIVGVPLWAYVVGKLSLVFIIRDSNKKNLITVMDRRRKLRAAFQRILKRPAKSGDKVSEKSESNSVDSTESADVERDDNVDENHQVNFVGFLAFWLMGQELADERTIIDLMEEFKFLCKCGQSDDPPPQLETVVSDFTGTTMVDTNDTIPMWRIDARLYFLQLVGLNLIEEDAWIGFENIVENMKLASR